MGTVVGGLASSLEMLITGRVIQALGVCAAAVLSRAIARDLFTGERLARALSLTMIATATAPGFSPLVGSVLAASWAGGQSSLRWAWPPLQAPFSMPVH